jgi:hypothetical protein
VPGQRFIVDEVALGQGFLQAFSFFLGSHNSSYYDSQQGWYNRSIYGYSNKILNPSYLLSMCHCLHMIQLAMCCICIPLNS